MAGTVIAVWWISILLLLVVTGVVALLLSWILRTGLSILQVAGQIWTAGKLVANNTIHIFQLHETNRQLDELRTTVDQILEAVVAVEQHAAGCPGCPACVLATTDQT